MASDTKPCVQCGATIVRTVNMQRWLERTQYCSRSCRYIGQLKKHEIARPEINIYSGKTKLINNMFIVNEELYDWLNQYTWHLSDTGYAVRRFRVGDKRQTMRMHRLVAGADSNELVDHINRNKLDNTVDNLRIATAQENIRNTDRYDNAKCYTWDASKKKYMVRINKKFIGRYETELEAINKVKELQNERK